MSRELNEFLSLFILTILAWSCSTVSKPHEPPSFSNTNSISQKIADGSRTVPIKAQVKIENEKLREEVPLSSDLPAEPVVAQVEKMENNSKFFSMRAVAVLVFAIFASVVGIRGWRAYRKSHTLARV